MQVTPLRLHRYTPLALLWVSSLTVAAQVKRTEPDFLAAYSVPIALLVVALLALLVLIGWVWCLVNAAKNGKWVWFVLMLLVNPLFIVYLLFADKRPPSPPPSSSSRAVRTEPYLDR